MYWPLTGIPAFLGPDNGVLISFKKHLQKRICHPLSQQKEVMLGTKETSSSLPDGVNSLLSGRRDKWLLLVPIGTPGPMLTPCSFIIAITCLKIRGWNATWSCGLGTRALLQRTNMWQRGGKARKMEQCVRSREAELETWRQWQTREGYQHAIIAQ